MLFYDVQDILLPRLLIVEIPCMHFTSKQWCHNKTR